MFQQNKAKILGIGTTPMFLKGLPFYIQMDVIPIRSEARSSQTLENKQLVKTNAGIDLIGVELLIELYEDQDWLIREQDTRIEELENRLADYEEELFEKNHLLQPESELKPHLRRSTSIEEAYRGGYQQ